MPTPLERIRALLHAIYPPNQAEATFPRVVTRLGKTTRPLSEARDLFSQDDITLITYGDSLLRDGEAPLVTLRRFLHDHLHGVISTVHILPFYPYSSDDGFSVIDYYAVNPELGTWDDVRALGQDFRLMFDAVINHMSAKSEWFAHFLANDREYQRLFMTASPDEDLSAVVRPRTTPLLTPFTKAGGETVHVWTTFSDDQVDLDYRDPDTMLRILDVLLFYVRQGAQVIRLDAIAFMWKKAGTRSLHLPPTHAIIQLYRAALDIAASQVVLITETNVPHAENVSYFGDGHNEAQLVYNFTLPPLLLHTMVTGNANKLRDWASTLETPSDETAFFNFTASHDGIGVRPVEGILTADEVARLITHVEGRGGRVSYRNNADGSRSPYELNITYVNAMSAEGDTIERHVARFIASQAVMLSLAGVPAIYIHSLLGTQNNLKGMALTGQNRTINRAKLDADTVKAELRDDDTLRARIFDAYTRMIAVRKQHAAFHPKAAQRVMTFNDGAVLGLERTARDDSERMLVLVNVTDAEQQVEGDVRGVDLLTGERLDGHAALAAYQVRWIAT